MKKTVLPITLILFLLLPLFSAAHADEGSKAGHQMDLKLTAGYVKDLETRKSFPDSVTFAYYYAYSVSALGEKVSPEAREKLTDFVKRCQMENGGFTSEPSYGKEANVIFTYYALKSLSLLNALDAIDTGKAKAYVLGLYQDDGGFLPATGKKGQGTTLALTFYGVESLRMLGALDKIDREKSIRFISGYLGKERKGYSMVRNGGASPKATGMAVTVLGDLGGLTGTIKNAVVEYLKSTRYSGLIEKGKYMTLPQLAAMAATIKTLKQLSALDQANTTKMLEFVKSLYIPENGGFGPTPGLGTTPPSTYDGIVCLVQLGKLPDPEAAGKTGN